MAELAASTEAIVGAPGSARSVPAPAAEGGAPQRTKAAEAAYPSALLREERRLLAKRRRARPEDEAAGERAVGVGLSGGGIRSATFCLGFFQGLAEKGGLLRKIDYLSTVSGGGYFGSFLGRLFTREYARTPEDVESILVRDRTLDGSVDGVVRNLRENGRYLSPNGSGDLLLGGAVLFRNWVSLQVVLWTFLLTVFLLVQVVRVACEVPLHRPDGVSLSSSASWVAGNVWWSPFLVLPAVVLVLGAVPLGWAYWLVERVGLRLARGGERGEGLRPFAPLVFVGLFAVTLLALGGADASWGQRVRAPSSWIPALLLVVTLLTPLWWRAARRSVRRGTAGSATQRAVSEDAAIRNLVSRWLKSALVVTVALLVLAVVDSLGQTLYLVAMHPDVTVVGWIGGTLGGLTVLASFARRLVVKLASNGKGGRVGLPADVVATVAGLLVVFLLLVLLNAAAHGVAWTKLPGLVPAVPPGVTPALLADGPLREAGETATRDSWSWLSSALGGFLFACLLSLAFGRIWPFLNRSSHQPLYSARLTRAYLGASNPARLGAGAGGVTRAIPGDDVDLASYWPPPSGNGAPLHLVNVTVNETVDGRSQVEQKDRKGMGLALGPCGLSVGVRHHVVAPLGVELQPDSEVVHPLGDEEFRVFGSGDGFRGEALPLGAWVGISGAAFSTGLGSRTSLGLSLLLGLANVRLGYWWDSGVDPSSRGTKGAGKPKRSLRRRLLERFAVQTFFLDELLARFPGTARRHWYLSDGGHFENMGGYELIRRRLPLIVIVDAEADPDYTFGGLANLVRKARLDFEAEIVFLGPAEIDRELPPEVARHVGSLEQLRRGTWRDEQPRTADRRPVARFEGAERSGLSLVHAALARVRYLDDGTESRLLYVKPSLSGDEPEDVLDYHRRNPDFPQETTADQFFDEAQWESYRRLGQHVAEKLFRGAAEDPARAAEPSGEGGGGGSALPWDVGRLDLPPRSRTRPRA